MNVRLHPGPLPQERGKIIPSASASNRLDDPIFFAVNHLVRVIATRTCELSSDVTSLSLSPEERAGVRASVNKPQHFVDPLCLPA